MCEIKRIELPIGMYKQQNKTKQNKNLSTYRYLHILSFSLYVYTKLSACKKLGARRWDEVIIGRGTDVILQTIGDRFRL